MAVQLHEFVLKNKPLSGTFTAHGSQSTESLYTDGAGGTCSSLRAEEGGTDGRIWPLQAIAKGDDRQWGSWNIFYNKMLLKEMMAR